MTKKKKLRTLVGVCAWRATEIQTAASLQRCMDEGPYAVTYTANDALISRARSWLASNFLREWPEDYNELLFIDTDIVFETKDLDKLVALSREKHAVTGGCYPVRRQDEPWVAIRVMDNKAINWGKDRDPVRVRYVSGGAMCIPRDILQAVADKEPYCSIGGKPMWPMFQPVVARHQGGASEYLSEDWAFCERVIQAGFQVWLHLDVRLGHLGTYKYTLQDVIDFSSADVDRRLLVSDLADYWNMTPTDALKRVQDSTCMKDQAAEWKKRNPQTPEEVDAYYREQPTYVEDCAMVNLQQWYWQKSAFILHARGQVADFGAGIGTIVMALARRGNVVYHVDFPGTEHWKFAEWRYEKHNNPNIRMASSLTELHDLDSIVAVETMEHIHPDALPKYAKLFWDALKPGGEVRTSSQFGIREDVPMHYDSEEEFIAAMRKQGFVGTNIVWEKPPA